MLVHTRATVKSFLETFEDRQKHRGRGSPADRDVDLLRAMLVFACSDFTEAILACAVKFLAGVDAKLVASD